MSSGSDRPRQSMSVYKCKELIHEMLLLTGQRDLLKRLLQTRLTQAGWTYSVKRDCLEYIRKEGVDKVNVSHMLTDMHEKGNQYFPDVIRQELASYLIEFAKAYVHVDDTLPSRPENEPDYSDPNLVFQYQSKDIKPDPGIGVGIYEPEPTLPPPPSPTSTNIDSPVAVSVASPISTGAVQSSPKQSPTPSPVQSPVPSLPRPLTPQPPLPILRPEKVEVKQESLPMEENEEEDEDEPTNNDEEEEEELMDV